MKKIFSNKMVNKTNSMNSVNSTSIFKSKSKELIKNNNKNSIKRNNSLECTCDVIHLTPKGIHKIYGAKCDFCSEFNYVKSLAKKSFPKITISN